MFIISLLVVIMSEIATNDPVGGLIREVENADGEQGPIAVKTTSQNKTQLDENESASSEAISAFVAACDAVGDSLVRADNPMPELEEMAAEARPKVFRGFQKENPEEYCTEAELEDIANCCPDWKSECQKTPPFLNCFRFGEKASRPATFAA